MLTASWAANGHCACSAKQMREMRFRAAGFAKGEVLNLLEIEGGVHPLLRNQKPMPVGAGASKEAPHDDENTGIDAHPPIPFRPD
jgi:hypothetical protein